MIVTEKTLGGYKKTVSRTETHFEKIYMYEDLYHYSTTMTRFKLYQSYLASKGIVCDIEDKHTKVILRIPAFEQKGIPIETFAEWIEYFKIELKAIQSLLPDGEYVAMHDCGRGNWTYYEGGLLFLDEMKIEQTTSKDIAKIVSLHGAITFLKNEQTLPDGFDGYINTRYDMALTWIMKALKDIYD
jgi:hypothetical protein|tara:strand:+ start:4249 stop:4806 length:558 start_codon:yes stop_codon:yes gene_type:complete